jgi:hypothetical protein
VWEVFCKKQNDLVISNNRLVNTQTNRMATLAEANKFSSKKSSGEDTAWVLNKILDIGKEPHIESLTTNKSGTQILKIESMFPIRILKLKIAHYVLIDPLMDENKPNKVYIDQETGEGLVKVTIRFMFTTTIVFMLESMLLDALKTAKLLDAKLQLKLDLLFQRKKMNFKDGNIILE